MNWRDRIVTTPDTLAGKPRIRNTRIAVEFVLDRLADGWPIADILAAYPQLTREDVLAALSFAAELLKEESRLSPDILAAQLGIGPVGAASEIRFVVEEAPEGGFIARALGADIFTEAADIAGLYSNVREAVRCYFDESAEYEAPTGIGLHFMRKEVITV